MKRISRLPSVFWLGALIVVGASGIAVGRLMTPQPTNVSATPEIIRNAQRSAYWGLNPRWIDWSGEEARFRQIRDRAFAFCFRDGAITRSCAEEQDGSVQLAIQTLMTVEMQRRMSDKTALSEKARWIATSPDVVARARSYCWALYNAHGGMDARLLSTCLSNLIDTSEVVPLPVRD